MKKRLFPLLMAMLMVFAMMPFSVEKTYADDPYITTDNVAIYKLNDDGTISGYYEDQPVDVTTPLSITIPASVTSVGPAMFSSIPNLTSVVFEDGSAITSLPKDLFSGCKNLKSITLPNNLTSIEERVFNGCEKLESIMIPSGVTSIGEYAFSNCKNITTITIPSGITSIEKCTFSGCSSLETITIPSNVTSIGEDAFENVTLTTVNFGGTREQWAAITGEGKPTNVTVNYGDFTVTFLDGQGNTLKTEIVKNGEDATAPDVPPRAGFVFVGWDEDYHNITSDLTVTAKWKKDTTPPEPIKIAVPTAKTLTYNGKLQTGVASGTGYTLSGASATNAGTYEATATLAEDYVWSDGTTVPKTIKWTINKAANPLTMKPKTATVKFSKLKKKAQSLTVGKVIKFTKQLKDKKTYTLSSAKKGKKSFKKYFKINKKTGKVTVKKGLKKGTYKVKVKVKAAGNANYNPSALKTVTFKVKVK